MFCHRLEKVLEALLSTFRGTELWDSVTAVIPVFEKVIGSEVKNTQAMTGKHTTKQLLSYMYKARARTRRL